MHSNKNNMNITKTNIKYLNMTSQNIGDNQYYKCFINTAKYVKLSLN